MARLTTLRLVSFSFILHYVFADIDVCTWSSGNAYSAVTTNTGTGGVAIATATQAVSFILTCSGSATPTFAAQTTALSPYTFTCVAGAATCALTGTAGPIAAGASVGSISITDSATGQTVPTPVLTLQLVGK